MSKVLIFGAAGFVGHYLIQEFLSHDYEVFGSDIKEPDHMPENIDFYRADILQPDDVKSVIHEVEPDIIINLAGISSVARSWGIPQLTVEVNVVGAVNIMEAAREQQKIPRILFVGSSEEYQETKGKISESVPLDANNPYGISKMTQAKFVQIYRERYGMEIYYVRPFNHTGVGQEETFVFPSFCKQIVAIEKSGKKGELYVGNLEIERDFTDVRDIVRAYRMVVESGDSSKVFNVGTGVAYSLREMLNYIISLSSQEIEIKIDPSRFRPSDNPVTCCDNSLIMQQLGWKPEYTIFDTLKEMYYYYLDNEK